MNTNNTIRRDSDDTDVTSSSSSAMIDDNRAIDHDSNTKNRAASEVQQTIASIPSGIPPVTNNTHVDPNNTPSGNSSNPSDVRAVHNTMSRLHVLNQKLAELQQRKQKQQQHQHQQNTHSSEQQKDGQKQQQTQQTTTQTASTPTSPMLSMNLLGGMLVQRLFHACQEGDAAAVDHLLAVAHTLLPLASSPASSPPLRGGDGNNNYGGAAAPSSLATSAATPKPTHPNLSPTPVSPAAVGTSPPSGTQQAQMTHNAAPATPPQQYAPFSTATTTANKKSAATSSMPAGITVTSPSPTQAHIPLSGMPPAPPNTTNPNLGSSSHPSSLSVSNNSRTHIFHSSPSADGSFNSVNSSLLASAAMNSSSNSKTNNTALTVIVNAAAENVPATAETNDESSMVVSPVTPNPVARDVGVGHKANYDDYNNSNSSASHSNTQNRPQLPMKNEKQQQLEQQQTLQQLLNYRDYEGMCMLHKASAGGYVTIVQSLIAAGANPLEQDKGGQTPLDLAVQHQKKYFGSPTSSTNSPIPEEGGANLGGTGASGKDSAATTSAPSNTSHHGTLANYTEVVGLLLQHISSHMLMLSAAAGQQMGGPAPVSPKSGNSFPTPSGGGAAYSKRLSGLGNFDNSHHGEVSGKQSPMGGCPVNFPEGHHQLASSTGSASPSWGFNAPGFLAASLPQDVTSKPSCLLESYLQGFDQRKPRGEGLCIILVGLPARGKSFVATRIMRYCHWHSIPSNIVNVSVIEAQLNERSPTGSDPPSGYSDGDMDGSPSDAHPSTDRTAVWARQTAKSRPCHQGYTQVVKNVTDKVNEEMPEELLQAVTAPAADMCLVSGGVTIIYGTASTPVQRKQLRDRLLTLDVPETQCIFLEVTSSSVDIVDNHIKFAYEEAVRSRGVDLVGSEKDFCQVYNDAIERHSQGYRSLPANDDENNYTYVVLEDRTTLTLHLCEGVLLTRLVYMLQNLSRRYPKPLFFCRPGEWDDWPNGRFGGGGTSSRLTAPGKEFAQKLAVYFEETLLPLVNAEQGMTDAETGTDGDAASLAAMITNANESCCTDSPKTLERKLAQAVKQATKKRDQKSNSSSKKKNKTLNDQDGGGMAPRRDSMYFQPKKRVSSSSPKKSKKKKLDGGGLGEEAEAASELGEPASSSKSSSSETLTTSQNPSKNSLSSMWDDSSDDNDTDDGSDDDDSTAANKRNDDQCSSGNDDDDGDEDGAGEAVDEDARTSSSSEKQNHQKQRQRRDKNPNAGRILLLHSAELCARETVDVLMAGRLGKYITRKELPTMNDVNHGDCERHTMDDIRRVLPKTLEAVLQNPYDNAWPNGESVRQVFETRLEPHIHEMQACDRPVVVVAHERILQGLIYFYTYIHNTRKEGVGDVSDAVNRGGPRSALDTAVPFHSVVMVGPHGGKEITDLEVPLTSSKRGNSK